MATSENVKINIQEVDTTTPLGPDASSDIAFVPGFSTKFDAVKNIPVLCNTVSEFEARFGKFPKVLTEVDVADYTGYGYNVGDLDRSHIYAKELLNKGMSVIYANVEERSLISITPNAAQNTTKDSKVTCALNGASINLSADQEIISAFTISGDFDIEVPKNQTTYLEVFPDIDITSLSISEFKLEPNTSEDVTILSTSPSVIGLKNDSETSATVNVEFTIVLSPSHFGNTLYDQAAVVNISSYNSSCLAGFYAKPGSNGEHKGVQAVLDLLVDKSEYSVKYITSGGYPSIVNSDDQSGKAKDLLSKIMIDCAATRGDAVALVDYQMTKDVDLYSIYSEGTEVSSVYSQMQQLFVSSDYADIGSFGAAMYPWGVYNCYKSLSDMSPDNTRIMMPASFGYLMCVATAIKTSPNWLAMAGVTRGVVPGLESLYTKGTLTNVIAEEYQPKFGRDNHNISVNAITNIRPYGLTLWGNRTLMPVDPKGTKALNFLNTRNMVSDIKKVLYTTAKSLMFEQDSDTLWLRFKGGISPLLNQLVSGNGISDYKIIRTRTKYNGDPLTRGEMAATIKIYPLYAVEYFELTVQISDQDVTVE